MYRIICRINIPESFDRAQLKRQWDETPTSNNVKNQCAYRTNKFKQQPLNEMNGMRGAASALFT